MGLDGICCGFGDGLGSLDQFLIIKWIAFEVRRIPYFNLNTSLQMLEHSIFKEMNVLSQEIKSGNREMETEETDRRNKGLIKPELCTDTRESKKTVMGLMKSRCIHVSNDSNFKINLLSHLI